MSENGQETKSSILSGRIYPTIQNCVNNRYKIVAGYIAVLGFLLVKEKPLDHLVVSEYLVFLPVMFTVFAFLNSLNYWFNSVEQYKLEHSVQHLSFGKELVENSVDILSLIIMLAFIWGGWLYLGAVKCIA